MSATNKLRVVTTDAPHALEIIRQEVEDATGFAVQPEIQEVDGTDLVVELRLAGLAPAVPGLVARAVERFSRGVDVLSTWNESSRIAGSTRPPGQVVLDGLGDHLPAVARRALRDDLPTAQWHGIPTSVEQRGWQGEPPAWQLAVPVVGPDGRALVGYQRRRGYSFRFGTQDVEAARVGLAS